ncbi:MAG: RNA polymerase sigma factor [Candidatus Paceibacterota bacterium]|jgi:RNA polymerase sigma-70 factor (ECF subfamily)|nr:RNA polymerase sigma factor [Candidatus Paceibacterota bacterium]
MQEKENQFLVSYDAHADALFRFAYFQVSDREAANDIVQDVFMETWKYLSEGGEIENFRAFLYRVARNRIIDHYRKHRSQSLDAIQESGMDFSDERSREVSEARSEAMHILRLLDRVDKKYREPVLLRYMEGMGVKEIAQILDESESNTSVLIHRGIEQLKKLAHI